MSGPATCREIFAFNEIFYNRQRLYQSLGYLTPLEFKRRISDSQVDVHKTRASSTRPLFFPQAAYFIFLGSWYTMRWAYGLPSNMM